jgi:hypothetical protein
MGERKMRDQHECAYHDCGAPASHSLHVIYVDDESGIAPDGTLDAKGGILADQLLHYCDVCYALVFMVSPVVIRLGTDRNYVWRQTTYAQLGIPGED